uniref:Poly [ADP-ribose] polymerase n=1 Tax=Branchiostoma floridae TaxID=7739 RepID=C3YS03_BRAFL|eukprot:XP_002600896.1 hypothetical protein BRAFLDRAFT_75823 [Branchiostoma floridae]
MSARARSVYVRGLPELSGLQDKVSGYFQSGSLSAGGAVTRVKLLGPGQALVTFGDETVAQNVLTQPQHTLQGTRIKVTACPPHLDVPEESAEDTKETEKAAADKTEEVKEDTVLSEEEKKVEQEEVEATALQPEVVKEPPSIAKLPRDHSSDSDYATPPESPTPKRLPVNVCHERKIDETKPVIVNSLLVQKQANEVSSDSDAASQHVPQLMAESCLFETLTETGHPEDDSPRMMGPSTPPEIFLKKPKPLVLPKPYPKPTTSSTAPKETTATSLQHANTEGESIGNKQQEHHPKPTPIPAVTTEATVTAASSQHPDMYTASIDQPQQPFLKPATSSSASTETSSDSHQHPNLPSGSTGEQPRASPATTSSEPGGAMSASLQAQQPNLSIASREDHPLESNPIPTTTSSVPCGPTPASPQQPNLTNTSRGDLLQQPHLNPSITPSVPSGTTLASAQQPNVPNAPRVDIPQQPHPNMTTASSEPRTALPSPQHPNLPNTRDQPQQLHPIPQSTSSVTTEATRISSQPSSIPNMPMEDQMQQPHPSPTTISSVPTGTTSPFPQQPNLLDAPREDLPQQPHPVTTSSAPGTASPSPLYPNLPSTSMGGYPQPQHGPFYHWPPPPHMGMMYPRPPLYPPQLPGSQAHFMTPGVRMPYGDPRHGFPWAGIGSIPPSGVQFQDQGHPPSGPQSAFFPQASHHTTGGPQQAHYMFPGQPASSIPLTAARSSPSSEVLHPYHHQPTSSQSPSWGSPRTGSPVSLPLPQQDRNRGCDYLPDQASSVHSRQTPTDLMSVWSDGESTFVDASDSVSNVGSMASDADSFVTSQGRNEATRPLGAAAKSDHHPSYKERNRKDAKLKRKAPYTMSRGASKTDVQAKKPFVGLSRSIVVSGFTSAPDVDLLGLYFESERRSGGGEVEEVKVRGTDEVIITFKDPSVTQRVLAREHVLNGQTLNVKELTSSPAEAILDTDISPPSNITIQVSGFTSSPNKEMMMLYFENKKRSGGGEIEDIQVRDNKVFIVFKDPTDFDKMVTKAQSRLLEGQQLTMERVPVTDAIIVTGLPDNVSRDLLELYFEREIGSSGGSVTEIKMDSSTGTAVVQFDDANTVNSVHQKSSHILNNTPISVQPYYECLGEVVDDNAPEAFQMPQPINVKIEPQLILFVIAMPKFIEQLTSKLAEVHAEVDMSVTDIVTVSPTLTPEMKGVRKLAKQWEDESRRCVEQFFSQFQATEITMATQIWERAKDRLEEVSEKVSTSNRNDVWIEGSDDKDGEGAVTLIGTKETVKEAELICKTIIKETEALLKWEASIVTDHIDNMKAAKLKILQLNNFTGKHPDVEIRLNVDNQSVEFKGQQALVQKAKIDLYETTNKIAEERVALSRGKLSYLKSDKGMKHLEDSLKKSDIKAAFAIENEEITILAQFSVEVKAAKDLLPQVVSESPIAIAEESRDLLTKQRFVTYSTNLRQKLSVDIHVAKDKVWVVGAVEKVVAASKDIKAYIATNTIVTINMDVTEGEAKYLDCYRSSAVKDVEKNHAEQLVKVMIGQGKLTVRGTKDGTQSAKKQLQVLIDDVTTGTMNITKPVTQRVLARKHDLNSQTLNVKEFTSSSEEAIPNTDTSLPSNITIQVSGFTSSPNKEMMTLYFENKKRSGGGEIQDIQVRDNKVFIVFKDPTAVNSVHQKSPHILNNTPISVQPYYECLGEVVDDNAPGAFQMPQPINVKIKPQLILFVIAIPTFIEQLTSKLAEVHAEVDMSVTDIVTVSPTLTPETKGVRKLAKLWEDKSRCCVEQFFTQFQAMEIRVESQIWQRAKDRFEEASEKVSTSNRDDVWIEPSDDKDGGRVVTLIGTTEAVTEAELVCKTIIKEIEELLMWEASIVTDHITNMKAAKLKILQLNNFPGKHPDVEIRLNVDNQSVEFKGQQALVQKAKIDLYETTNKIAEERVALSRGKLSYLKSDKGMKHLEDSLKKSDIKAAFAIENEEITILAQFSVEVKAAKDLLPQVVSESPIAIAEESRDLLTKQRFVTYSTNLRQKLSVDIHVAKDKVWVVGAVEKVVAASKDIKAYVATNTIVTINMDVTEGKAKYLDCYRSSAVKDVEKNHAEQLVKVMIGQGKLTVKGTKDGTQSAKKQLQVLIDDVTTGTMNITKPGMHKFFTKGSGSGLLKGIEREVKCVIQVGGKPPGVPVRDMGGARTAAAPAAPGGLKQICYHTTERRKLVVVQGNLTSHRVDVMVNTANGSLSHGGGLAAAIVKAGGQEIQRDCTNYIKDNGKLTEGQVMSTKGYKLPCKMVVHAVGPLWIADQKDSKEKALKMAVENALLEARDYHSIAIPAISSGEELILLCISGYPIKPCVAAIVAAVTAFFNTNPDCALSEVHFAEMDPQKTDAFRDELLNRFGGDKVTMTGSSDTTPSRPVPTPRPRAAGSDAATSPSNTLITPEGIIIQLKKGNITAEKADVLVNTTSGDLDLSQGGVARAFGQAGGQELQQLCNNHGKANAGDIVITLRAGTLRCKQVYHAVLPNWQESDQPLRTMVQDCLESADQGGYTSISFPAMGTGNLKYPRDVAASCMYDEILSFSQSNPGTTLQDVGIIVFDQPTVQAFETELRVRQGVPGASGTASGSGPYSAVTTPMPGQQQMTIGNVTLQIQGGDLTAENVDCIVNVTSKDLGNKIRFMGYLCDVKWQSGS